MCKATRIAQWAYVFAMRICLLLIGIYFEGYSIFLVAIFQKVAYLWATIVTKLLLQKLSIHTTHICKIEQMHTYSIKSNIRKKSRTCSISLRSMKPCYAFSWMMLYLIQFCWCLGHFKLNNKFLGAAIFGPTNSFHKRVHRFWATI